MNRHQQLENRQPNARPELYERRNDGPPQTNRIARRPKPRSVPASNRTPFSGGKAGHDGTQIPEPGLRPDRPHPPSKPADHPSKGGVGARSRRPACVDPCAPQSIYLPSFPPPP